MTVKRAKAFIATHHRHNDAPVGGLWASAVADADGIRGVAIAGNPSSRILQDDYTLEITRVGTDGVRNGCSMLYAACLRAAKALGYRRVYTYTLASESGSSLRAVGFVRDAEVPSAPTWDRPSRRRGLQMDLIPGVRHGRPTEAKVRWVWKAQQARPGVGVAAMGEGAEE